MRTLLLKAFGWSGPSLRESLEMRLQACSIRTLRTVRTTYNQITRLAIAFLALTGVVLVADAQTTIVNTSNYVVDFGGAQRAI